MNLILFEWGVLFLLLGIINSLLLLVTAPSTERTKVSVTGLRIWAPLREAQHSKPRAAVPPSTVWKLL